MPTPLLEIGTRVTINPANDEVVELHDKHNQLIARFLPGYGYRVTGLNREMLSVMVATGQAVVGNGFAKPGTVDASNAKVAGQVKTK
jgi:hypothetical protein